MRIPSSFAGLALFLLMSPAVPAWGSFEKECSPPADGEAVVGLTEGPSFGSLTYSGTVICPRAFIEIDALTLERHTPTADNPGAYETVRSVSAACGGACRLSGLAEDQPPGFYRVTMSFSANASADFRSGKWVWIGVGDPVPNLLGVP